MYTCHVVQKRVWELTLQVIPPKKKKIIPFTISWLRNGEDSGRWGIAFKERLPLLSCFCGEKTSQEPQRSNGKLRSNNPKIARKISQSTNPTSHHTEIRPWSDLLVPCSYPAEVKAVEDV